MKTEWMIQTNILKLRKLSTKRTKAEITLKLRKWSIKRTKPESTKKLRLITERLKQTLTVLVLRLTKTSSTAEEWIKIEHWALTEMIDWITWIITTWMTGHTDPDLWMITGDLNE